jgi:hypothetical protein
MFPSGVSRCETYGASLKSPLFRLRHVKMAGANGVLVAPRKSGRREYFEIVG